MHFVAPRGKQNKNKYSQASNDNIGPQQYVLQTSKPVIKGLIGQTNQTLKATGQTTRMKKFRLHKFGARVMLCVCAIFFVEGTNKTDSQTQC